MTSPAGARAEIALRSRHREAWGAVYTSDHDHLGDTSNRKVLVEAPSGAPTMNAEYKSVEEGPLRLDSWQLQMCNDALDPALPFFLAQFTHPGIGQPWAFPPVAGQRLRGRPDRRPDPRRLHRGAVRALAVGTP